MHLIQNLGLAVPICGTALTAPVIAQAQSVPPDETRIITPQQSVPPSQLPQVTPRRGTFTVLPTPLTPFPVVKPEPDSPADPSTPVPNQVEPSDILIEQPEE